MSHADWIRAYLDKLDGKQVSCPECGMAPVEWRLAGDPVTRLGFVVIWCGRCRKGSHLSRVGFPEGVEFVPMSDVDAVTRGVPDIQFVDDDETEPAGAARARSKKKKKR